MPSRGRTFKKLEQHFMVELNQDTLLSPSTDVATDVYVERVVIIEALTALVYDYLLTIEDEKELIWPSRLSSVKVFFFLNRYAAFIGTAGMAYVFVWIDGAQHCRVAFWAFGGVVIAENLFAELILYVRAYAIWERKKASLYLLGTVATASWTFGIYFAARFLQSGEVVDLPIFPSGCIIEPDGHVAIFAVIALLISETVALSALLLRASEWRGSVKVFRSVKMPSSMILRRIYADGIIFYLIIFSISIANLVILITTPSAICNFLVAPQAALHSICCNRLLFRIKKSALQASDAIPSIHLSAMTFDHGSDESEMELR